MHVQQAYGLFARRVDRSLFQVNISSLGGDSAWALAATAAASLSGQLDDCLTNDDLDGAIKGFLQLYREGVVSRHELEAETGHILLALVDGEEEMAAACLVPMTGQWNFGSYV